jgi:hypothetical protein
MALDGARARFPGDFNLDLLQARTLVNLGQPLEAILILETTHVLPSENARESHRLWEQAHLMAALNAFETGDFEEARTHALSALEWPEHLGQGRPYEPDERLARFILANAEERLGHVQAQMPDPALRAELEAMAADAREGLERDLIERALRLGGGEE